MRPFYNEEELDEVGPLFYSAGHYHAVYEFLSAIERLSVDYKSPILRDLHDVSMDYTAAVEEAVHEYRQKNNAHATDHWKVLCKVDQDACAVFIHGLMRWAEKYHLNESRNDLYIQIAAAEARRLYYARVHPLANEIPPETASLTRVLFLEDAGMRVSDGRNGLNALPYTHPFVFSPSPSRMNVVRRQELLDTQFEMEYSEMQWEWDEASRYEGLLDHRQGGPDGKVLWRGIAWDRRDMTWPEFDTQITRAFEAYKKAYRVRAEAFFDQHHYKENADDKDKQTVEHFKWLADYQVFELTQSEVAKKYHTTRENISQRIKEAQRLALLLSSRPSSPPGRPSTK